MAGWVTRWLSKLRLSSTRITSGPFTSDSCADAEEETSDKDARFSEQSTAARGLIEHSLCSVHAPVLAESKYHGSAVAAAARESKYHGTAVAAASAEEQDELP